MQSSALASFAARRKRGDSGTGLSKIVEWEEARRRQNNICRLSVSLLVAMNCLSKMHMQMGRARAAHRVMDAALQLQKKTFLLPSGTTAGEPGGLLHRLGAMFDSPWPGLLRTFERSLTEELVKWLDGCSPPPAVRFRSFQPSSVLM